MALSHGAKLHWASPPHPHGLASSGPAHGAQTHTYNVGNANWANAGPRPAPTTHSLSPRSLTFRWEAQAVPIPHTPPSLVLGYFRLEIRNLPVTTRTHGCRRPRWQPPGPDPWPRKPRRWPGAGCTPTSQTGHM